MGGLQGPTEKREQAEGDLAALLVPAKVDTCLYVDQAWAGRGAL